MMVVLKAKEDAREQVEALKIMCEDHRKFFESTVGLQCRGNLDRFRLAHPHVHAAMAQQRAASGAASSRRSSAL